MSPSRSGMEASYPVRQTIADQAHAEAQDDDRKTWKQHDPGVRQDEVSSLGDHEAPFGRRRLHAEAKKAQGRPELHVEREVAHGEDDGGRDRVRQDMAEQETRARRSEN